MLFFESESESKSNAKIGLWRSVALAPTEETVYSLIQARPTVVISPVQGRYLVSTVESDIRFEAEPCAVCANGTCFEVFDAWSGWRAQTSRSRQTVRLANGHSKPRKCGIWMNSGPAFWTFVCPFFVCLFFV